MELLPLGPVLFIDTAGIDDVGALGELRAEKTRQVFDRTDLGVLVTEAGSWGEFEDGILDEFQRAQDAHRRRLQQVGPRAPAGAGAGACRTSRSSRCSPAASEGRGVLDFRQALLDAAPPDFIDNPSILGDLVNAGELAVLVVPIDKEAPRGPADPAAGAEHPRPPGQRRDGARGEGARAPQRPRAAQPAAEARRHRLAGVPQGGRRHAARGADDELLDPLRRFKGDLVEPGARARWRSTT